MRQTVIRSGLEALYFTGAHRALSGLVGGVGAILTMHHVRPARPDAFQPNRLLEVTPDFLEAVITALQEMDFAIVTLDEMHGRLSANNFERRCVCLTFDDGYRDNLVWAYPILKRHAVPFTVYVPTAFPEGRGDLWWLTLEAVVASADRITWTIGGSEQVLACATPTEKRAAFATLYWSLRALPGEQAMREAIHALAMRHGVDTTGLCTELCMTWSEIAELAADPLVTIGAHTVNHFMLRKVDRGDRAA